MAALARCRVVLGPRRLGTLHEIFRLQPMVLVIDLEVHARGVVEDEVNVEAQQISSAEVDGALDSRLLGLQEVHREVKVL